MTTYTGWRASPNRAAALSVNTIAWSRSAPGQTTTGHTGGKTASIPLTYRAIAMMLAIFLALRSRN